VVAVDNACPQGSGDWVESYCPWVTLVRNQRNLGFAAAAAQGFAQTPSEFVLLLNPDVVLHQDYLAHLLARAQAVPGEGSWTGKLWRSADAAAEIPPPGQTWEMKSAGRTLDSTGLVMFRSRWAVDRGAGRPDCNQHPPGAVFGVSAAAALYRRAAWEDVGPFDAGFHSYLEDVDWAWRARLRGWGAAYVPRAAGWHHRHGSGAVRGGSVQAHITVNRLVSIVKLDDEESFRRDAVAIIAFTVLKLLSLVRTPAAYFYLPFELRRLAAARTERRAAQRRARVRPSEVRARFEPWRPWSPRAALERRYRAWNA
jgi:GT2 family glycosyltransferase